MRKKIETAARTGSYPLSVPEIENGLYELYRVKGFLSEPQAPILEGLASALRTLSGLERERPLAKADPNNTERQNDLSVCYNKVGDVLLAQSNLTNALKSLRDAPAIADRLAKADPNNAERQRDLSVCYNKTGDSWSPRAT